MRIIFGVISWACTLLAVQAANVVLSGANYIDATTTVGDPVSGSGYYVVRNNAVLTLSGRNNTFTGGIIVSNGLARANYPNSFGTGAITLAYAGSSDNAQVYFARQNGTFGNDVIKRGKGVRESRPDVCTAAGIVTLNGRLSLACDDPATTDCIIICPNVNTSSWSAPKAVGTVNVNGDVAVEGGALALYGYTSYTDGSHTTINFNSPVKAAEMWAGYGYNHFGVVALNNAANAIETFTLKRFRVELGATNVLRNAIVQGRTGTWSIYANEAMINMNGHDQAVRLLTRNDNTSTSASTAALGFRSDTPATLTVTGAAGADDNGITDLVLNGAITLVVNNTSGATSLTQQFDRRCSTMTGPIAVSNGVLRLRGNAQFSNVTAVDVLPGSALEFENTASSLPALEQLTVGGIVRVQSGCTTPFNAGTVVTLGSGGRIAVYKGLTCEVDSVMYNGRSISSGTYTSATAAWMVEGGAKSADYTGTLVVKNGGQGGVMAVW